MDLQILRSKALSRDGAFAAESGGDLDKASGGPAADNLRSYVRDSDY
jgi:hypothetical protein